MHQQGAEAQPAARRRPQPHDAVARAERVHRHLYRQLETGSKEKSKHALHEAARYTISMYLSLSLYYIGTAS